MAFGSLFQGVLGESRQRLDQLAASDGSLLVLELITTALLGQSSPEHLNRSCAYPRLAAGGDASGAHDARGLGAHDFPDVGHTPQLEAPDDVV